MDSTKNETLPDPGAEPRRLGIVGRGIRRSSKEVHFYTVDGHFAFLSLPSPWGLEATYAVHSRLIGKAVVDVLAIIEFFSLGVKAEALRVNIDWKYPLFLK